MKYVCLKNFPMLFALYYWLYHNKIFFIILDEVASKLQLLFVTTERLIYRDISRLLLGAKIFKFLRIVGVRQLIC
jgi:hypothetical protein